MVKWLGAVDRWLGKSCAALVVTAVAAMLTLALATIVGRWFGITYSWLEPLVRHLVLVTAFLGGILATGENSHINIDLLGRLLKRRPLVHALLQAVCQAAAVGFLLWLASGAKELARVEFQFGKEAFLGIHSGFLLAIIPAGLAVMAFRFFVQLAFSLDKIRTWH